MRILFLSNFYPPYERGGMEQLNWEVARGLQARGHQISVLTSRTGSQSEAPEQNDVNRSLFLEAGIHYYRPLDFFVKRAQHEGTNRRELRGALETFKPDVVFVWSMWNLSPQVAYWAEQWMPGRVAYAVASYWLREPTMHEAYWQQPSSRPATRWLMAPVRWWALRTLARERRTHPLALEEVACVSEYVRRELDAAGALPHHARVIYNGINPAPYLEAQHARSLRRDEALRLIYVGQLLPHKGVHTAIEALGIARNSATNGNLSLTVVGGGHPDYTARLKERVEALDLEEQVTFRGQVPREQIPALLGSSDVFLFTSIWAEPIARSVMEAMAAGLTVVGTPVGGQSEMLQDGSNALVFTPDDPVELADRILKLHGDASLRRRLAEAGQQTVLQRFTLARMVNEIESWLEEVVQ